MFCRLPFAVNILLTLCLAAVALLGDFLVSYVPLHLHKALCDNATHAAIAAISWLIVCICGKCRSVHQVCVEVLACGIIASFIDLDHFLSARSLSLKAAVNLKIRPVLHCTTIPILLCLSFYVLGLLFEILGLHKVALLIFTAALSHHIRDANRRGFWIYPFGSTPSLPKWIYIALICLLPHAICFFVGGTKRIEKSDVNRQEYVV